MNDDHDLKQMFAAAREVDEQLAPDFHELTRDVSPAPQAITRGRWLGILATSAVALVLFTLIGVLAWQGNQRGEDHVDEHPIPPTVDDMDQACDSLLAAIERLEPVAAIDEEMAWPTETDFLLAAQGANSQPSHRSLP